MAAIIQRFRFEIADSVSVPMPKGGQILHITSREDRYPGTGVGATAYLWVLVDPEAPIIRRHFWIWKTDERVSRPEELRYITTFFGNHNENHVFEDIGGADIDVKPEKFAFRVPFGRSCARSGLFAKSPEAK